MARTDLDPADTAGCIPSEESVQAARSSAPQSALSEFFSATDHAKRSELFDDLEAKARSQRLEGRFIIGALAVATLVVAVIAWPEGAPDAQAKEAPQATSVSPPPPPVTRASASATPKKAPSTPVGAGLVRPAGQQSPRLRRLLSGFAAQAPLGASPEAELAAATDDGPGPAERAIDAVAGGGALADAREALEADAFERVLVELDGIDDGFEAQVLRGRALFELGRDAEALRALSAARAAQPENTEVLLLVGALLQTTGDRPGARAAYTAFLAVDDATPQAAEIKLVLASL